MESVKVVSSQSLNPRLRPSWESRNSVKPWGSVSKGVAPVADLTKAEGTSSLTWLNAHRLNGGVRQLESVTSLSGVGGNPVIKSICSLFKLAIEVDSGRSQGSILRIGMKAGERRRLCLSLLPGAPLSTRRLRRRPFRKGLVGEGRQSRCARAKKDGDPRRGANQFLARLLDCDAHIFLRQVRHGQCRDGAFPVIEDRRAEVRHP